MDWNSNPKTRFNRNHIERCWKLNELSSEKKDTTYRNLGVGQKDIIVGDRGVTDEKPMNKEKPMEPYWNFWRAVFAGWLIRYPGQIFKGIGMFFLFIIFMIFMAVSPEASVEQSPSVEYNENVR